MAKTLAALIVSLCLAFSAAAAENKGDAKKAIKPAWSELTPPQQQILAPLQGEWDQLDATRRKKWVRIADRYATMKPDEQQRLQKRMQEWSKLTPDERRAAREKYQSLKKASPEQRKQVREKWREYEQSSAPPAAGATPAPAEAAAPPAK